MNYRSNLVQIRRSFGRDGNFGWIIRV